MKMWGKKWGGHKHTIAPPSKKVGGHMSPLPPASYASDIYITGVGRCQKVCVWGGGGGGGTQTRNLGKKNLYK